MDWIVKRRIKDGHKEKDKTLWIVKRRTKD